MNEDYRPPNSPLYQPAKRSPRPLKGILLGIAIDIGGTTALSIVLGIFYSLTLGQAGQEVQPSDSVVIVGNSDSLIQSIGMILGLSISCLAGYVCSYYSQVYVYRHTAICASIICMLAMILFSASGFSLFDTLISFAAIMSGSWVYLRILARKNTAPRDTND